MRAMAAVASAFLLAASPAWAAPYLQASVVAARTGMTDDPGPAWDDVAFVAHLPGSRAGPPLIVDGAVMVLTTDLGLDGLHANGVFRLDLATGGLEQVVDTGSSNASSLASDGERLFVAHDGALEAYPLTGGSALWAWPFPRLVEPHASVYCAEPAVRNGTLYIACSDAGPDAVTPALAAAGERTGVDMGPFLPPSASFAAALDASSGAQRWLWVKDALDEAGYAAQSVPPDARPVLPADRPRAASSNPFSIVFGLSVLGSNVFVTSLEAAGLAGPVESYIWSLQAADGRLAWSANTSALDSLGGSVSALPTGDESVVYLTVGRDLLALNPARGNLIWEQPLGAEDTFQGESSSGFAVTPASLFATSLQTMYRFDRGTHATAWTHTLPPESSERFGTSGLILAGSAVYARTFSPLTPPATSNAIYAFDAESGTLRWRRAFDAEPRPPSGAFFFHLVEFAVGEGVMAIGGIDGNVTVLGRTPMSMVPRVATSSPYPAPGEPVVLDMAGSAPGSLGPPSAYRVDWGDGSASDWQASPRFTHAYNASGDAGARAFARNDAGQTASEPVVLHVGGQPPVALSPLQEAFSDRWQNLTLFVLGLAITGVATAPRLLAHRRARNRVQVELAAINEAFARTRDKPAECDAMLAERKARARGLQLDGKVSAEQLATLERHVDELAAQARLRTLDHRFAFLPHGMVLTLQGMLADGRINAWERQVLLDLLDKDTMLTRGQKARTRELVEGWFARDSRGRA
jgi:outer membrane protein assembly factor BamB